MDPMAGLWMVRSRPNAAASGASTPGASRGEESRRRRGAAASRMPPPKRARAASSTPERTRPRRTEARRHDPDLHALVGPASESAEAHEARHPKYGHHQTCPRCRFYKIGPAWVSGYGTMPAAGHGPDRVQWIADRPSHWGGPWALGCTICAHAMAQQQADASSGASTPPLGAALCQRRRGGAVLTRLAARC